jgi:hypothetical protein
MPLPEEVLAEVPEAYRDSPSLKDYNSVGDALKSLVETKALVGNSLGRMPDQDAGPEALRNWAMGLEEKTGGKVMMKPDFANETQTEEFYLTIGKPSTAEGYESPEDSKLPPETDAELRQLGFKHHLTKAQLTGLMTDLSGLQETTVTNLTEARETDMRVLKDKWGRATDERIDAARKTLEEYPNGRNFDHLTSSEIEALYKVHTSLTGKGAQVNSQKYTEPSTHRTPKQAKEYYDAVLKRVGENKEDMSREERMNLTKEAMEVMVKEGGADGDINSLRAGRI